MRIAAFLAALLLTASAVAQTTTNNDDSCDIAQQPAATLLLPYFEVDFAAPVPNATSTFFWVQNVSHWPQIANVTLWTDWGYPAFSFPLFLTGYDVQSINLHDVFTRGEIAPFFNGFGGTSNTVKVPTNPTPGSQPSANNANPNHLASAAGNCANLPGLLSASLRTELQTIFTTGVGCGTPQAQVGGRHANAIGYATIDVVATCAGAAPASKEYFNILLYDNVLVGDYVQLVRRGDSNVTQGGPLVPIRAVPEGGRAGVAVPTSLPYTFYDRYTAGLPARTMDRRQPLPSVFAPRFIDDGPGSFTTSLKIWREGMTPGGAACSAYAQNSGLAIADVVRFDEHENAAVLPLAASGTPLTAMVPTPKSTSGDTGGWLYVNLNNGGSPAYSVGTVGMDIARDFVTDSSTTFGFRQSQNWVIASMSAAPLYTTDMTAAAMGNGCSPSPRAGATIAPARNATPAGATRGLIPATTNNDDSCDIALQPAATLLLPYFDVDFKDPSTTALVTIQNVSPQPRIANVTLWTDWGYPAVNFPIRLTGYGVQGLSLYDVFTSGALPATECGAPKLSAALVADLQSLFTTGRSTGAAISCSAQLGSNSHGPHAVGYATVDVVASCSPSNAASRDYFATLLYDNVLTGDVQQLGSSRAVGSPLVHIRAVPEGGAAGAVVATSLPYTFYDRFTPSEALRKSDRRQPLPSLFAPHYINGGNGSFNTSLKIWREGITVGACSGVGIAAASNSNMAITDVVRFDEHENATIISNTCFALCPPGAPGLPTAGVYSVGSTTIFPAFSTSGDVSGWLYFNLDNGRMKGRPSQNWIAVTMLADPTLAFETIAPALGNGCTPPMKAGAQVGPAP